MGRCPIHRECCSTLALAAVLYLFAAWPMLATAQSPERVYRLGHLAQDYFTALIRLRLLYIRSNTEAGFLVIFRSLLEPPKWWDRLRFVGHSAGARPFALLAREQGGRISSGRAPEMASDTFWAWLIRLKIKNSCAS